MQSLTLRSGPLAPRVLEPTPSGLALEYDDLHSAVQNGRVLLRLTPLEYALFMALLRQRKRHEAAPEEFALCCGVELLRTITKSSSDKSVHKHLNTAARKVEALGIRIIRLHAENRYMVLLASEVEGDCEDQEAPLVIVS